MQSIAHILSLAAHHSTSPDNAQPWQFTWQTNTLTVSYDVSRVGGKTFSADSNATLLTIGALIENINQAADALGVRLDWNFSTFINPLNPVYFQVTIRQSGSANSPALDSIPLFKRHTNRHPYKSQALPEDSDFALLKKLTQGSARVLVLEDRAVIKEVAELVRSASEIRFQTQEVHEWLGESLRFDVKRADKYGEGLDVATLDLPPGGRLFLRWVSDWQRMKLLNRFGVYKVMSLIDALLVGKSPALVAIVSQNTLQGALDAGQLMARLWIALNERKIAVQPYYVVSDQLQRRMMKTTPQNLVKQVDSIFEVAQECFELNTNEALQMLFRVGYSKINPVLSKRLPLEDVCSGIDFKN